MKITLTKKQKQELEGQHDMTRDGRVRDRIKAVPLASEDWSTFIISLALRCHKTTVLCHLKDDKYSEKLRAENSGASGYISVAQTIAFTEYHE